MKDYKQYKWFYTAGGKLVVGGKSAMQNDDLLEQVIKTGNDYYAMHTAHPGSPFCVIIADKKTVTKKDLTECAIFTGCFSRAWKARKRKTTVDIFTTKQLFKTKAMKTGTWGVQGNRKSVSIELRLALTKQKNTYRAVPEKTVTKKETLLVICPGSVDKIDMLATLATILEDEKLQDNELLAALPAGGVKVCT